MTAGQPSNQPIPVVLIDDDPQHLGLVQAALAQQDLDLLPFTNPEEGLQVILRKRVPIVLVT